MFINEGDHELKLKWCIQEEDEDYCDYEEHRAENGSGMAKQVHNKKSFKHPNSNVSSISCFS